MKIKVPFRALCLCALALSAAGLTACSNSGSSRPPGADENQTASAYQHVVQSGETLGMIADWYTGRSSNWKIIMDNNPGLRPERLRPGQIVLIPRNILIKDSPIPKGYSKKARNTLPAGNSTGVDADKSTAAAVENTTSALDENKAETQPAAVDSGLNAVEEAKTAGSETGAKIEDAADDSKAQAEAAARAAEEAAAAAKADAERAAQKAQADAEAAAKAAADAAEGAKKQPKTTPDDAEREKLLDELLAQ